MSVKDNFKQLSRITDLPDGVNYCILEDAEYSESDGWGGSYVNKALRILRFSNEKDQREHFEIHTLASRMRIGGAKNCIAVKIEKNLKAVTEVRSV